MQPPIPHTPIQPLPRQHNPPKHHLKCPLPRLMLEIMHSQQRTRPAAHHRHCMQRRFSDAPLHVPRLHLVVAVEHEGDAAGYACPCDGEEGVRDGVQADERDCWEDERHDAGDGCGGKGAMAGLDAGGWHIW
jgi:hypothetical protein